MSCCHVVNVHRYVFEAIVGFEFTRGIIQSKKRADQNEPPILPPRFHTSPHMS